MTKDVAVVAHGGAGSPESNSDGCRDATRAALQRLNEGASALDAAIAAVVRLEDDGRFNAGSGSILGLDGEAVEMDAAVMDDQGQLGAVACVSRAKNPVLLAAAVARTPHWLLAGAGADRLAQVLGLPAFEGERSGARQRHARLMQQMQAKQGTPDDDLDADTFERLWNYTTPWEAALRRHGHGTVGAVVRDAHGRFAVATSTGGCAPALLGRVGDTPIVGCGYYAGPLGAVAATGVGEFIVQRMVARQVYDWIAQGRPLQQSLDEGVALLPHDVDIGLIGVTRTEAASSCNRGMAVDVAGPRDERTA